MIRPGRQDVEFDLEGPDRRRFRQLRHRPVPGHRRARAGQGQRRRRSPKARTGWKAPAWRSPCWNAARRPSIARAREMKLLADGTYHLAVGSTEMGNGIVTAHKQIAAGAAGRARRRRSTSSTPIPTARPTTPAPSPAPARWSPARRSQLTAEALRDDILDFASRHTGVDRDQCRLDSDARASAATTGSRWPSCTPPAPAPATASRPAAGPISRRAPIAFNVQGVRLAVHRDHRRDPHPAQRACRRYRPADQSDAVPRPDRRRGRHGLSAGR